MEKEVSNNTLLFLAIIAIGISIFSIYSSLQDQTFTGAAVGHANVTISESTTITLSPSSINFTDTALGIAKDSGNNADVFDCAADNVCGINITNDGSVYINVSLETTQDLFTSPGQDANSFRCRVNGHSNTTSTFYESVDWPTTYFSPTDCRDSIGAINNFIAGLNFTDGFDNAYVDINISVPNDEESGSKVSIISFTATKST